MFYICGTAKDRKNQKHTVAETSVQKIHRLSVMFFSIYDRSKHFLSKLKFASNDLHKICLGDL